MTSKQSADNAELKSNSTDIPPPCPLWKKVLVGLLAVALVFLFIYGTVWVDQMEVSWVEMLTGLAVGLGYSIILVLAGIVVATTLIWVISRIPEIMRRGSSAIEYLVHCYPDKIKNMLLHRG